MKPPWLPDWENDLAKYPKTTERSRPEWAWQFLRRNAEYQKLWSRLIQPHYRRADLKASLDRADRDGIYRNVGYRRIQARLEEFRYQLGPFEQFGISTVPPDPAEPTAKLRFSAEFIRYARTPSLYKLPTAVLAGDEVVVWFNLNRSIDQQLAKVKTLMKTFAAGRRAEAFRFRPETYQRYLRLLDARAVGARNPKIASVLYPRLRNTYPDYDGNRQVRNDVRTAERLRDHDFLRIAAGGK